MKETQEVAIKKNKHSQFCTYLSFFLFLLFFFTIYYFSSLLSSLQSRNNISISMLNLTYTNLPYSLSNECYITIFHNSNDFPHYFRITIGQLLCWSNCTVIFLLSSSVISKLSFNHTQYLWLNDHRIKIYDLGILEKLAKNNEECESFQLFQNEKKHIQNFFPTDSPRPELWFNAFSRTFYLEAFMIIYNYTRILSIEGDCMWFMDPAELIPILKVYYPNIAAPRFNSDNTVLSPLWINNVEALQEINMYILRLFRLYPTPSTFLRFLDLQALHDDIQEMHIHARAQEDNPNIYDVLPSDPFVYYHNSIGVFNPYISQSRLYGTLFDPGRHGHYIAGSLTDPPGTIFFPGTLDNYPSESILQSMEYISFSYFYGDSEILWGIDHSKRPIPYIKVKDWSHPITSALPLYRPFSPSISLKAEGYIRWPLVYRLLNVHWYKKKYFWGLCPEMTRICSQLIQIINENLCDKPDPVQHSPLDPLIYNYEPSYIFPDSFFNRE